MKKISVREEEDQNMGKKASHLKWLTFKWAMQMLLECQTSAKQFQEHS